jgi:dTDP-4-dehydrorhamnose 3,5-epimerase-like enzyme
VQDHSIIKNRNIIYKEKLIARSAHFSHWTYKCNKLVTCIIGLVLFGSNHDRIDSITYEFITYYLSWHHLITFDYFWILDQKQL